MVSGWLGGPSTVSLCSDYDRAYNLMIYLGPTTRFGGNEGIELFLYKGNVLVSAPMPATYADRRWEMRRLSYIIDPHTAYSTQFGARIPDIYVHLLPSTYG